MLSSHSPRLNDLSDQERGRIEQQFDGFSSAWKAFPNGGRPSLETFLDIFFGPSRRILFYLLLPVEL
jgi:hypothetical protein